MSVLVAVVTFVAVVNAPRLASSLPAGDRDARTRVAAAVLGTAVLVVAAAALAAVATPLLDALDLSPPTARLATGIVLAGYAVHDVLAGPPPSEPALPGVAAGLVPLGFPVLVSPAAGLLAVSAGVDVGIAPVVLAALVAAAPLVALAARPAPDPSALRWRLLAAAGRAVAVLLVVLALGLVVDGIFDI